MCVCTGMYVCKHASVKILVVCVFQLKCVRICHTCIYMYICIRVLQCQDIKATQRHISISYSFICYSFLWGRLESIVKEKKKASYDFNIDLQEKKV